MCGGVQYLIIVDITGGIYYFFETYRGITHEMTITRHGCHVLMLLLGLLLLLLLLLL